MSLRILSHIPMEMEYCQEYTNSDVTQQLNIYLQSVLYTVHKGMTIGLQPPSPAKSTTTATTTTNSIQQ